MFTGLVMEVGEVAAVRPEGGSVHIHVRAPRLCGLLADGDSLAVNGVCLTITRTEGLVTVATAVPETLRRTTLGSLTPGQPVNLEPALRLGDRLGGHLVQGHVDGVGTMLRRKESGLSLELTLGAGPEVMRYVVHKGSIAIDGVSLTVAEAKDLGDGGELTVALVPHTMAMTTLPRLRPGQAVNLEADILAKYVERLLGRGRTEGSAPQAEGSGGLSEAWLRKNGFA